MTFRGVSWTLAEAEIELPWLNRSFVHHSSQTKMSKPLITVSGLQGPVDCWGANCTCNCDYDFQDMTFFICMALALALAWPNRLPFWTPDKTIYIMPPRQTCQALESRLRDTRCIFIIHFVVMRRRRQTVSITELRTSNLQPCRS